MLFKEVSNVATTRLMPLLPSFVTVSCRVCGKSIHLGKKEAEQLLHSTLESTGFQIDKSETILYGICEDCRKK